MDYIARQAPRSMGFSRQELWSGLLYPPPGDLPVSGIEPSSLTSPVLAGRFSFFFFFFTPEATWEAPLNPAVPIFFKYFYDAQFNLITLFKKKKKVYLAVPGLSTWVLFSCGM